MLGTLRFGLSLAVAIAHIGALGSAAVPAVFGFYVVSGFLITRVLQGRYTNRPGAFLLNRALRIYPMYFVVALVSALALNWLPDAGAFNPAYAAEYSPETLLGNLLIFPFVFLDASFRLVPPVWSICVEIVNYCLLLLVVGRSFRWALAAFALSCILHGWLGFSDASWEARYYPFYSAILPFSCGALIYFIPKVTSVNWSRWAAPAAACGSLFWLGIVLAIHVTGGSSTPAFNWLFYGAMAAIVIAIFGLDRLKVSDWLATADKWLGELSYPIFLTHWIVGLAISRVFFNSVDPSLPLFLASLPIVLLVSFVLVLTTATIIDPVRDRVRRS